MCKWPAENLAGKSDQRIQTCVIAPLPSPINQLYCVQSQVIYQPKNCVTLVVQVRVMVLIHSGAIIFHTKQYEIKTQYIAEMRARTIVKNKY
jgi:hypothetical protein